MPILHPWSRQKGESPTAYKAFIDYRDAGNSRSLTELTRTNVGRTRYKEGTKSTQLGDWSSKHGWVERCRAWDNHLQDKKDEVIAAAAIKWEERRQEDREADYELATKLRERCRAMLAHPIVRSKGKNKAGEIIVEPASWTQRDIAVMVKIASEVAAVALSGQAQSEAATNAAGVTHDPNEISADAAGRHDAGSR